MGNQRNIASELRAGIPEFSQFLEKTTSAGEEGEEFVLADLAAWLTELCHDPKDHSPTLKRAGQTLVEIFRDRKQFAEDVVGELSEAFFPGIDRVSIERMKPHLSGPFLELARECLSALDGQSYEDL
ncbi:MAG: hypothetical protein H7A21_18470 [Spirochaetales bacterium]|nr:hypothetical protein [Spirochaetales bacterium]